MNCITVTNLQKTFDLRIQKSGFFGSFRREIRKVEAVKDITFSIETGERVAFIGPNGAGKSTTIKMLSGILVPTGGNASVLGYSPWQEREKLSYKIGIVFGNRSQLWSHLPVHDSLVLLGAIYDRDKTEHQKRMTELTELLEVTSLLSAPANKLSLGERMRCELVASLLHRPTVLFLDEPTIGLDVSARSLLRDYIRKISEIEKVTILLTSHDTGDIEHVCDRVIVINHGSLVLDQPVKELRKGYIKEKRIRAITEGHRKVASIPGVQVAYEDETTVQLTVDTAVATVDSAVRLLFEQGGILDLTIEDPPLEDTIMSIYRDGARKRA